MLSITIGFILIVVIVIGCVYSLRNKASRLMSLILVFVFVSYLPTTRALLRYIIALTPFILFVYVKGLWKIFMSFRLSNKLSQKLIIAIVILVIIVLIPSFLYSVRLRAQERKV
ncbi:unnamed protein product, partial [marine sediment metagenome]